VNKQVQTHCQITFWGLMSGCFYNMLPLARQT